MQELIREITDKSATQARSREIKNCCSKVCMVKKEIRKARTSTAKASIIEHGEMNGRLIVFG